MRELFSRAAKYLAQKRRHKIWIKVVSCLACAVVFCTTYALILPAITAEKTTCGYEEHVHEEECYAPNGDLTCQLTEHTHTEACYTLTELSEEEVTEDAPQEYEVSEDAVQETAAKSLPQELSGVWAEDVLAVAESQLGYRESTSDYIVDENDEVKGYTCYGDWYGNPYGDWCAEFVSFCMRYANVVNMPYDSDCANWIAVLSDEEYGLYEKAEEYQPNPGDIIFFDWEQDGISDHVGIVEEFTASTETENGTVRTIEGDSEDAVSRVTYSVDNPAILGYGRLPEMETGYICGKISHTHNIHCYDFKGEQILCPAEEHSHTEDCSPQPETPAEEAAALEEAAVPVGLAGDAVGNSVTFKVMIDGEWKALGSCSYNSGEVDGSQRAYITSDMAERFFGAYGYTAGTEPGSHFGYSYDDIYHIFYTSNGVVSNFCMDVRDGIIAENKEVQIYGANNTDAQTFRIWQAEEGYSYITPIANSSLHINVLGGGSRDGTKLALHSATDDSSRWKLVSYDNGTTAFYSKNAPDSACIDVDSGRQEDGVQLQIWANGDNRYWHLDKQYRISNNIVSSKNSDGTYNIGLTEESNGDIVCYYLPGETEAGITNAAEDEISKKNSFWSVTVRDDNHAVYTDEQLRGMVQYVKNSGQATVTVQNGNGILWSCTGKNGEAVNVVQTESGNSTTFVLTDITQPTEIVATKDNPSFTVQYYANIPRLADSGGATTLAVIDTSGGILPTNGSTPSYKSLQLEGTNQYTGQNRGDETQLYKVMTKTELTKMYTEGQFQYETSPDLYYFNKLKDNTDYNLEEIWVLKSGRNADSTNRDDWEIYPADAAFTNKADEANDKTILLNDGAVIRLVSGCSNGDYVNETTFYDYNISSGQNDDGRWRTGITGINAESNYGTSINGERTWSSYADVLAFGNANCGTGMSGYLFADGTLNKYN
ncbi:MAG: CHAP domain-containing protein, partial [Eubacteriales bacterium]|nr:CHAP domain-containing protein [Eubacteriales bacterium]